MAGLGCHVLVKLRVCVICVMYLLSVIMRMLVRMLMVSEY